MKKTLFLAFFFLLGMFCEAQKSKSSLNLSTDLVSNFIFRGSKIGNGPAIQSLLEFATGGLAIGTWGSYYFSDPDAIETDLYASYSFNFGLKVGINDYYFPTARFFDSENHAFELQSKFQAGNLDLSANYIVNEGVAVGEDLYFEVGYKTGNVRFFAGGGNGWHTTDSKFAVCNVGLSTSKDIKITDLFSIPLKGSVIFNPETELLYLVVGITL